MPRPNSPPRRAAGAKPRAALRAPRGTPLARPARPTREGSREHIPSTSRGGHAMHNLLRDIRMALRSLRRAPGFAAAAVLTLALGVGTSTALFTVLDAALLR